MKQLTFNLSKLVDTSKREVCISDLACRGNLCCVGTFEGEALGLTWNGEKFEVKFRTRVFDADTAVRKVIFSVSGKYLLCGSSNGRLAVLNSETGKVKIRCDDIFGTVTEPIGAMVSLDEEDCLFAFGNDQGDVKILDLKNENSLVVAFDNFDDQVTDMVHLPYRKQLICCSGDGTFMVIDLKRKRIVSHSNSCDDEFTAIAAVKNGDHILLGSGLGEVSILKYNYWGEFADRLPAHPGTVNCLLAESFHSTVFYTGCSDGTIRKLQIHPNEIIAEVGHLNDSVERMALFNPDEETSFLLAATCEDGVLRAFELGDADDDDNEGSKIIRKRGKKVLPSVVKLNSSHRAFFADL